MAGEIYSAVAVPFQLGFSGSFSGRKPWSDWFSALQAGMRLEVPLACGTGSCHINLTIE